MDPTLSPPDRPRTGRRLAAFLAALALTAALGWQAGRLVAAAPPGPAGLTPSAPNRS